jgi:hypothetical protein
MGGYTSQKNQNGLAASVSRDLDPLKSRLNTIEQDVANAAKEAVQKAQSYLEKVESALSEVRSLKETHFGKPYMTSDLESRVNKLISDFEAEVDETKKEIDKIGSGSKNGDQPIPDPTPTPNPGLPIDLPKLS